MREVGITVRGWRWTAGRMASPPIARFSGGADSLLASDGLLALEIGYDQGEAVTQLCRQAGVTMVRIEQDLGRQRPGRRGGIGRADTACRNAKKHLEKSGETASFLARTGAKPKTGSPHSGTDYRRELVRLRRIAETSRPPVGGRRVTGVTMQIQRPFLRGQAGPAMKNLPSTRERVHEAQSESTVARPRTARDRIRLRGASNRTGRT